MSGTDVVRQEPGQQVAKREPHGEASVAERQFDLMKRKAVVLANSGMLAPHFKGKPEAVMAVMLTLDAVGAPVTIPLINLFDDIKGNIQPRVQFLIALAAARGVDVWMPDEECDDKAAVAYAQAHGGKVKKYTYTWDQAQRAGLTGSDTYKKHPGVMLQWRAAGRLLRTQYPHVALGLPTGLLEGNFVVEQDRVELQAGAEEVVIPDDDEVTDAEVVHCETPGCTIDEPHRHDPAVADRPPLNYDERPFTDDAA